jgi:protein involved in polysaccharide export with SLBB domain
MSESTRARSVHRREPSVLARARVYTVAALLLSHAGSRAIAQNSPDAYTRGTAASRPVLDSLATRAEAAADAAATPEEKRESLRRYAAELRTRLRDGDFQPGDRIVVTTREDSTPVDTLTVQSDRTILVEGLPSIPLNGVLRSELPGYLRQQVRQYVKRDVVRAIPLVRVGVLGEVVHPGYYRVPLQITLSDLLMVAGGPLPQADLTRVRIRRGQATIIDEHSARDAMVRGMPLDELGIDAGDEVVLRPASQRNWLLITQIAGVATGLALTLHTLKIF